jgi:hypothetical protein
MGLAEFSGIAGKVTAKAAARNECWSSAVSAPHGAVLGLRLILDCGGKRSATPLLETAGIFGGGTACKSAIAACALPAQSIKPTAGAAVLPVSH